MNILKSLLSPVSLLAFSVSAFGMVEVPFADNGIVEVENRVFPTKGRPRFWPFGRRVEPTFMHRYGYYEIRCRLNRFAGWHSAFWIQAPGVGSHPDPAFGGTEVDIMESWKLHGKGVDCGYMVGGVIAGGYGSDGQGFTHFQWRQPGAAEGWHNYGVLWTPHGRFSRVRRRCRRSGFSVMKKRVNSKFNKS